MADGNDNTSISIPDVELTIKNCKGRSRKPLARKGVSVVHSRPQNVTNEITPVSVINNITTRRLTRASFRKDEIKNDAVEKSANEIPIAVMANKKRQTRKRKINCTSVGTENSQNFTPSKIARAEIECSVDSKSDNLVARDNNETSDMDDDITDNRNDAVLSANMVKRNVTIAANDIAINVLPTEMHVDRELSIHDKSNEKINDSNNIDDNSITDDTSSFIEIPSNECEFILSSTSPSSLPSSTSSSIKKFSKVDAEKLIFRKVHANVTFLMKNRGLKPNLSCAKRLSTPIPTRD